MTGTKDLIGGQEEQDYLDPSWSPAVIGSCTRITLSSLGVPRLTGEAMLENRQLDLNLSRNRAA